MKIATLEVDGMLSALSSRGIEWPRRGLRGVAGASGNYATGGVPVGYDEARVEIADAKATPVPASAEAAHADATAWPGGARPTAPAPTTPQTPAATRIVAPALSFAPTTTPATRASSPSLVLASRSSSRLTAAVAAPGALTTTQQGTNMKTSAIEVHDMLSVFTVYEVEKRIGEVPGVESATVNFAVGNATVRYDETRVDAVNIKSSVRPRSYEASAPAGATPGGGHEGHEAPATLSEAPKSATPDAPPAEPAAAPVGEAHKGKVADENS